MSEWTENDMPLASVATDAPRVIRVEGFEAPFSLAESEREAYLRRFSTLFVDERRSRRGGLGRVFHATNALGEQLAVKTLILPQGAAAKIDGVERNEGNDEDEKLLRAAFRREYECQRSLALLRGFPRLFGYGTIDGAPAIVMEWVEGATLAEASEELAIDAEGRVSPLTVAHMGRDLFELVSRLSIVGGGLVHRDISPANIMVRTTHRSLARQRTEGSFDLCLIDFGSAEPAASEGSPSRSFTAAHGATRHATADYAPPEMLSDDIAAVERQRHSTAVDVYSVGSVLCELLGGKPPFPGASRATSPYRLKTETEPTRPAPAHDAAEDLATVLSCESEVAVIVAPLALERDLSPHSEELASALSLVDAQIVDAVMSCLLADQRLRPNPELMRDEFDGLSEHYGKNIRHALAGEPLVSPSAGRSLAGDGRLSPSRHALRVGGRLGCGVIGMSVALATAWLVGQGDPGRITLVAALLVAPSALALLVRWRNVSGRTGLLLGGGVLLAASAGSALGLWRLAGLGERLSGVLAALFVCACATWLILVIDYASGNFPAPLGETPTFARALGSGD